MTARGAERPDFAALTERHRRELHVHCYRMLASFDEAEDAVQETLLRAWRARDAFDGSTGLRPWLYRIATRVCLDLLRRRARRPQAAQPGPEVPWLQPYPDRLLDEVAATGEQPDAVAVERETIELLFLAALQLLPPRQRAVLIARDVLGWHASEAAVLLETSVAAVNSALQRARETMRLHLPARRDEWAVRQVRPASAEEEALLARFIDAHERCDAAAAVAIAAQHLRVTMPPYPYVFEGRDAIPGLMDRAASEGDWRLLATRANRMPAAASYLRRPGDTAFRAFKLDVLRIDGGAVAEITTFGPALFDAFGLSATL
jgi:RNA polymerase sigma-70 factor (ECF subfamily)